MTTEITLPQTEVGPELANGQGQSQGHRRRRRRRKNKSSQASAAQPQQPQAQAPAQPPPQAPAQPQQQPARHKAAPARQGGPQNQERRKKKFFQKGSATAAQPGNSISGPPQGKRKGGGARQKGPREFVGPMDHSYRIVNGNVADGPPSTIQVGSNGHGSHYQDAYEAPAVAPVREDARTRIFCFIEDLFFQA